MEKPIGHYNRKKYCLVSLMKPKKTVKELKGRLNIKTGFINLMPVVFVYGAIVGLMLSLGGNKEMMLSESSVNIILVLTLGGTLLFTLYWLITSFLTHTIALRYGGKGNYREYAVLASFPETGAVIIAILVCWIPLLGAMITWLMGLIPMIAKISMVEEEYGLHREKAMVSVIAAHMIFVLGSILLLYLFINSVF